MATTIGFVGLGAMGSRITGRLLAAGYQVYGTNRTAGKAAPLIERGLIWRMTPRSRWWPPALTGSSAVSAPVRCMST